MEIRIATEKDIPKILNLLNQVLEIHAEIRPDIFIPNTTKYSEADLKEILKAENRRTYIAADENDEAVGYAFCEIQPPAKTDNMLDFSILYIDDLCVDASQRGKHIGEHLFNHIIKEAKSLGCRDITLNVWEGNNSAKAFYKKMGMSVKKTMLELKV